MASFPAMTTTNAGERLLAKGLAGKTLQFTKIVLGDGALNGVSISTLTALISQKTTCEINSKKTTGTTYQVGGLLLPANIAAAFYWREVGLIALDPDDSSEVLFSYSNAGTATDYIDPTATDSRFEKNIYISTGISTASSVTVSIPSSDTYALADLSNVEPSVIIAALETSGVEYEKPLKDAAAKTAPVDADKVPVVDSADSSKTKLVLWSGIRSALGSVFAALNHTHTKSQITDFPTSMAPTTHASTHATGGSDPLTPGAIGASTLFPQVTVSVDTGATVTATVGTTTVTGTSVGGSCILNLPNYGNWTFNATLNSETAIVESLTIDAVKQYAVTLFMLNTTLNDNTWEKIKEASDAGIGADVWSVGDTKTITINGTVGNTTFSNLSIEAFILGFNHNSSREGANRIHFQIGKINGTPVALVDSKCGSAVSSPGYFSMNYSSDTNSGGWSSCQMRNIVLGSNSTPTSPTANTLLAALPSDLRAVMKSCTKYSDNTGGGSDTAGYVTSTTDYLFLLSEFEYHGARTYANSAEQNYQAQYAYYQAGNSKIKYKHNATGTVAYVWCRSVCSISANYFCLVDIGGSASNTAADSSHGVPPAFCV